MMGIVQGYTCMLFLVGVGLGQELTIKKIINTRPDLALVNQYLNPTDVMTFLGNSHLNTSTFFASNNRAFESLSRYFRNQLNGTQTKEMQKFFNYHLIPREIWGPEMMNGKKKVKLNTNYGSTYLYVNKIKDKVFVNNAEIVNANLRALNGRCHVIDRLFVHLGPKLDVINGKNAYSYLDSIGSDLYQILKTYRDYTISSSIVPDARFGSAVKDYINNPDSYCTLFVPDNEFLYKFKVKNEDIYSKILGLSPGLMKRVIESLIIPNWAFHVRVLLYLSANEMKTEAIHGSMQLYTLNNEVYISNQCGQAKITQSDIVTNNCIVHYIDNFLGLVNNNTFFTILSLYDLSDFHRTMYTLPSQIKELLKPIGGFETTVKESDKYTIFAPTNGVFRKVDFSDDAAIKLEQLQMIMVRGVVDLTQLSQPIRVETLRPGYYANIRKVGQEILVEVNHVEAKVVEANICTLNGLIHKVDRIVGLPDSTIQEFLDQENYRKMYTILEDTGLMTSLINPTNRITLFAVNQSAIDKMSPMFLGQQNKNKLRDLTMRHLGNTVLFLDTIKNGDSFNYETFNGPITVSNDNGVYWVSADGEKVKVLKGNMLMENGVIHVVSGFLPYKISSAVTTNGLICSKFFYFLLSAFVCLDIFFKDCYHQSELFVAVLLRGIIGLLFIEFM